MLSIRNVGAWVLCIGLGGSFGCAGSPAPGESSGAAPGPISNARQLTFEGRRAGEGYFNRTGDALFFQSEREPGNPFYQIYRLDLASGDVRRISTGIGKTTCAWAHPDGERVLFASTHHDPDSGAAQRRELEFRASGQERRYSWDFDEQYELYAGGVAGGAPTRLTRARGYDAEGSYSPDGSLIVFASNRHAFLDGDAGPTPEEAERFADDPAVAMELYRMNADGSDVRRLTRSPGYDGGPFFSPDGQRIVFRRFSLDGATAEIFTMDLDGSDVRQLTRLGALSWAPFFHPSGDYVVFATNVHGFANFELYVVDAAGEGEPVRVTDAQGLDGLPAFSPDGRRVAWTSTRTPDGSAQLFLGDWNHAAVRDSIEVAGSTPRAPTPAGVSTDALRTHVEALTDERMGGRPTGGPEEQQATLYVARAFERLGLEPAGDDATYFASFDYSSGVSLGPDNALDTSAGGALRLDVDWRPIAFSRTGTGERAPAVFAGYGIVAPDTPASAAYDSYQGLDVQDRWVVVLRFLPEDLADERRQVLIRHSGIRYKAMVARDRGARGLIVVNGPRSQARTPLIELRSDASISEASVIVLSLHLDAAQRLLGGRDLEALQQALDGGDAVPGFPIEGLQVEANVDLVRERSLGRNVIGRLRGTRGAGRAPVVIGAHVDHLGRGESGSLAREDERGRIHPGADDNASGVAALLEVAAQLASAPPERDVIFAAWSGEELGLLGSSAFVEDLAPPSPHGAATPGPRAYAAYLNMDMVGRLGDRLTLNGIGSSSIWRGEVERLNVAFGLPISLQEDSYVPSDSTSFYLKGIPVLGVWTGAHGDYHTPRDTADRINYGGLRRITRFMTALTRRVADRADVPDYVAMTRPEGGRRALLRAYLGTIPDYANTDQPGLALSGVIQGGPAEEAGLRAGDVIVELAGRKVENIYDYTYAIEALVVGAPVTVRVVRGGAPVDLELTPRSRQ